MFDTLKYAKVLEEVGFTRAQSETSVRILSEVMDEKFATKQDLITLRSELKVELEGVKSELVTKMWTMHAITVGLIVTLMKLL